MMGAILLATGAPAAALTVQRQLDFIVSMCRADKVVRFVAQGDNKVSFVMNSTSRLPTVSENSAFQCALTKVKQRSDLQIVAHPATTKAQKN